MKVRLNYEQQAEKTYLQICLSSENSDASTQFWSASSQGTSWIAKDAQFLPEDNIESD